MAKIKVENIYIKTEIANRSRYNASNLKKIIPFDSSWWGESNEHNLIKIGSLEAKISAPKVLYQFKFTKSHVT